MRIHERYTRRTHPTRNRGELQDIINGRAFPVSRLFPYFNRTHYTSTIIFTTKNNTNTRQLEASWKIDKSTPGRLLSGVYCKVCVEGAWIVLLFGDT